MPAPNPLLERWHSGGTVLATWLQVPDPVVAELMAGPGVDAVVVDQQHGGATTRDLVGLFMAIEGRGSAPITRVPQNDGAAIGRSLDAGALGIIVPMVDTPEEAAAAVSWCRYGPGGRRSYGPRRRAALPGPSDPADVVRPALILQIETTTALRNADAIAATPGVDALLVGPTDLALSLGMTADPSARSDEDRRRHDQALEHVRTVCVAHGIAAGMYCTEGAVARGYVERGFRFVSVATDAALLAAGLHHELQALGIDLRSAREQGR